MKTFKVLLLVMLLMAIASPAKANDINAGTRVSIEAIPLIDNPADPLTVNPYDFVDLIITEENTGDVDLNEVRVDVNENGIPMEVLDKFTASGDDGDGVLNPLEVWSWTIRTEIRRDTTFEAFGYGERIDGQYWKILCWTLFRRPNMLPVTITIAIHGYHFRKICELKIAR